MVAVIAGQGTGLERSSVYVLGSEGVWGAAATGRSGDNVYVNAATGNLVIQNTDEMLLGLGKSDINLARTYNSQGTVTANGWQESTQRQVSSLTGTVNTAGSTINHVAWDGSVVTYTYNATLGAYVGSEGAGPVDTLTFSGTTWTWKDGGTGVTETYDSANGGRITGQSDLDGNTLSFTYTGSLLTKVTTQDGEFTTLSYTGNNLTQITTTLSGGQTLTRVRYGYDTSNRLTTVTVDLSPGDNSISDAATYVTTYGYDGTSNRVNSITQSDGSSLSIGYTSTGSGSSQVWNVTSFTQTVGGTTTPRTTSLSYNPSFRKVTVTDPLGQVTSFVYDTSNNLYDLGTPPLTSGGSSLLHLFTYNSLGEVLSVTAPDGAQTVYTYDANGNQLTVTDPTGDKITRTFDANNLLLTETTSPATGVSQTTRYAYDAHRHLRFVVSATGDVTEYRYNAAGLQTSVIRYAGNSYTTTGAISESGLNTWVAGISDLSTTQRTDTTYDFRGNVQSVTSYSKVLPTGVGDTTATKTTVNYVYDQAGNLLSRQQAGSAASETYVYDGLFRQTVATDLSGATTSIAFDDAHSKTVVTLANGTTQTSVYSLAGDLLLTTVSASGLPTETTSYAYDADGRLRMTTDPTGVKSYILYDSLGRKVADIAADGAITEYRYNAKNEVAATIEHATKLTSTQLSSLVTSGGAPAAVTLASVLPAANAADRWTWTVYDTTGRAVETIDATGAVTVFTYDKAGQLTTTTSYANVLSAATLSSFMTTAPSSVTLPTADSTHDNVTRDFYDADGRLVAVLDGDGRLTQTTYDGAGEAVKTVVDANVVAAGLRASGTLSQLITSAGASSHDETTSYVYDAEGELRYKIDGANQVCEYVYDAAGNVLHQIEYATAITPTASYSLTYVQSHLATSASDRTTRNIYDAANRLAFSINAEGGVVGYTYDSLGHVVKTVAFATLDAVTNDPSLATMQSFASTNAGNTANRITRTLYNAQGQAVYAVDAEGYVTESQYDLAGRVTKQIHYAAPYTVGDATTAAALAAAIGSVPASAAVTTFGYDAAGRLTDVTDPMGIVTHSVLDALGQVSDQTVAYGTADASTTHFVYDAAGRVLSQTAAYGTSDAVTTSSTYNGQGHVITSTDGRNSVTSYGYDAVGQMISMATPLTDTTAATTSYVYDAFGNRVSVTDPRNDTGFFYYDNLNRLVLQVDPEGYVTQTSYSLGNQATSVTRYANRATNLAAISATVQPVVSAAAGDATTMIGRDKLDRVTSTTDAELYTESYSLDAFGDRMTVTNKLGGVTTNTYDRRGLLLSETLPITSTRSDGTVEATSVTNSYGYDARGNRSYMIEAQGLIEARVTAYNYDLDGRLIQTQGAGGLNEITKYDARGDVIETDDSVGARTLFYYDHLGRKTVEIDPMGTMSTWSYDQDNNVTAAVVYATAVTLPVTPGGAPPAPPAGDLRQTLFTYDRGNRLIATRTPSVLTGQVSGGIYQTSVADVVTQTFYDSAGNAVQQVDANGNSTYSFYDKLGRKIAQVDPNNYLTFYSLDANGNVLTEERIATAITGTVTASSDPVALRASVIGRGELLANEDRVTNFSYDRNGRRLTETRLDSWGIGGPGINPGQNAQIVYTYNGLGEVTSKREATNETTTFTYDTEGRQTAVTSAAFLDYTGSLVAPQTQTYYDGLGEVVRTRMGAAGVAAGTDRINTFIYVGGRMISTTDAMGNITHFSYDADGRQTDTSFLRLTNGASVLDDSVTHYDADGRVTFLQTSENGVAGDYTTMGYDAYGELTTRGVNGGAQESFSYDNAGRLWRTNSSGGVLTLFLYDAAGNRTLEADAAGADISSVTEGGAAALVSNSGVAVTYQVFDARSQVTQTIQKNRQLTSTLTQDLADTKQYNAWGEITQDTDARGGVSNYVYNTLGKVIVQFGPSVQVVDEHGVATTIRPITSYGYDNSGRLHIVTDANGNLSNRKFLPGTGYGDSDPVEMAEYHPDGIVAYGIDVYGNVRTVTNEIGAVETRSYNALNQLIEVDHAQRANGIQLKDYYSYDQSGHQLAHWNNELTTVPGGAVAARETTDYDAQGRIIKAVDFAGHVTTTSYQWQSGMQTVGLGAFGGWVKTTTTDDLSRVSYQSLDYFGRTDGNIDQGGHVFYMEFDTGGRLAHQYMDSTVQGPVSPAYHQNLVYTYFNTGKVATLTDAASAQETFYGYDQNGNQTDEQVYGLSSYYDPQHGCSTGPSTILQQTHVTYDAANRMLTLHDAGYAGGPSADITYSYDANGNIRHVAASYTDLVSNAQVTQDDWYKYDLMNRVVTTEGDMVGGNIVRGQRGADITYDAAGNRLSVTTTVTQNIQVAAHWVPDTMSTVTVAAHTTAAYTKPGWWTIECVPASVIPASTSPGYWEDVPALNLHDGHTVAGYYATECVPAQDIPGSTTPGYWEEVDSPGYWIPGSTTPGYWITDASGNNVQWVDPVTSPDTWVPGDVSYIWHDPVTDPDTIIPAHTVQVWVPPVVVPDTIIPEHQVWHDPVTTPEQDIPAHTVQVWNPPVDVAAGTVAAQTTTVLTPGHSVAAGMVTVGTAHAEYYTYTADGYLSTVSISDGAYNTATGQITAPDQTSASLRSVDLRDAMGRVTDHVEFASSDTDSAKPTTTTSIVVGSNEHWVPPVDIPATHTDAFFDQATCAFHPEVDTPEIVHAGYWAPDDPGDLAAGASSSGATANEQVTPGTYAVYEMRTAYDNDSNEIHQDTATLNADGSAAVASTDLDYVAGNAVTNVWNGVYVGGVVTHTETFSGTIAKTATGGVLSAAMDNWLNNRSSVTVTTSDTHTDFDFWSGAVQMLIHTETGTQSGIETRFTYNGDGYLQTANINDGRPRTITYVDNALGQIIARLDSTGPRSYDFNFEGVQRGEVTNNGAATSDMDAESAIYARQQPTQTGPFENGQAVSFADFDQSYIPINGLTDQQASSSYTVRDGDTLQSIAQAIWGDSSLWYLIADANGLNGSSALVTGMSLTLPNKITNLHNNTTTDRPYDPNKAIGDVNPFVPVPTPQPAANKKHGCGGLAEVLVAIVAVVVTIATSGAAAEAFAGLGLGTEGTAAAVVGTSISASSAAGIAGLATGAALGSIVSQGVAIATGVQSKFNWGQVGLSAISAGVSGGLAGVGGFSANPILAGAERGVVGNVVSQGLGLATGLQSKFDWAGVAVSGVVGGVAQGVGSWAQGVTSSTVGVSAITGAAAAIAGGATRSLLTGSDFGDNILSALPSIISSTVGSVISQQVNQSYVQGQVDDARSAPVTDAEKQAFANALDADPVNSLQWGGRSLNKDDAGAIFTDRMRMDALYASPLGNNPAFVEQYLAFRDGLAAADAYNTVSNQTMLGTQLARVTDAHALSGIVTDDKSGTGYQGYLYHDDVGDRNIFANAGTNDFHDLSTDYELGGDKRINQLDQAQANARQLVANGVKNLTFTGHSLGGALAILQGLTVGAQVVTFNSAPLSPTMARLYDVNLSNADSLVTNYRVANDPLSNAEDRHATISWALTGLREDSLGARLIPPSVVGHTWNLTPPPGRNITIPASAATGIAAHSIVNVEHQLTLGLVG